MNTRLGKSFGLAFMVAVGILAVMFALGTFNAQQAGADVATETDGDVEYQLIIVDPDDPSPSQSRDFTVAFKTTEALDNYEPITIELKGFGLPSSIDPRSVLIRQATRDTDETTNERGVESLAHLSYAQDSGGLPADVTVSNGVITVEFGPEGTADNPTGWESIALNTWAVIRFRQSAGLTAPAEAGDYDIIIDGTTKKAAVTVARALTIDPSKGASGSDITVSGKAFANGSGTIHTAALGNNFADYNEDGMVDAVVQTDGEATADNLADDTYGIDTDNDGTADHNLIFKW